MADLIEPDDTGRVILNLEAQRLDTGCTMGPAEPGGSPRACGMPGTLGKGERAMAVETATRREFLTKSVVAGATVAGAGMLAPAVEAAAPGAPSGAAQVVEWWDWWSPVGSPSTTAWFAWVKKTFEAEN